MNAPATYSRNFSFLAAMNPELGQVPTIAERLVYIDPAAAMVRVRYFGEMVVKYIFETDPRLQPRLLGRQEQFVQVQHLRDERAIPEKVFRALDRIRKNGNDASHEGMNDLSRALTTLQQAFVVGIWLAETYGTKGPAMREYRAPTQAPENDVDLRHQIKELTAQLIRERAEGLAAKTEASNLREQGETAARDAEDLASERDVLSSLAVALEESLRATTVRYEKELRAAKVKTLTDEDRVARRNRSMSSERTLPDIVDFGRSDVWLDRTAHLASFVGRDHELTKVTEWAGKDTGSQFMLFHAVAGQGKSAFAAALSERVAAAHANGVTACLYYTSKAGLDARGILQFLQWQAIGRLEKQPTKSEFDGSVADLVEKFSRSLDALDAQGTRTLVVIDGLDEVLTRTGRAAGSIDFLPKRVPTTTKVFLSLRTRPDLLNQIRSQLGRSDSYELGPMSRADTEDLVRKHTIRKQLDRPATDRLLDWLLRQSGGSPLVLDWLLTRRGVQPEIGSSAWAQDSEIENQLVQTKQSDAPESLIRVFDEITADLLRVGTKRSEPSVALRETLLRLLAVSLEPLDLATLLRASRSYRHPAAESSQVRRALSYLRPGLASVGEELFSLFHDGFRTTLHAQLLPDDLLKLHRSLAGAPLCDEHDVGVRFASYAANSTAWLRFALLNHRSDEALRALTSIQASLTSAPVLRAAVMQGELFPLISFLDSVISICAAFNLASHEPDLARIVKFLAENSADLSWRPSLLGQLAEHYNDGAVRRIGRAIGSVDASPRFIERARLFVDVRVRAERQGRELVGAGSVGDDRSIQSAQREPVALIIAGAGCSLGLWSTATGEKKWSRGSDFDDKELGLLQLVAISASAEWFASYCSDWDFDEKQEPIGAHVTIAIGDAESGRVLRICSRLAPGGVEALQFSDDGQFLVVGSGTDWLGGCLDGQFGLFCVSIPEGALIFKSEIVGAVTAIAISKSCRELLAIVDASRPDSGEVEPVLLRFSAPELSLLGPVAALPAVPTAIESIDDSHYLIGFEDGTVCRWSASQGVSGQISIGFGPITHLSVRNGRALIRAGRSEDSTEHFLVDVNSGVVFSNHAHSAQAGKAYGLTSDGEKLIRGTQSGTRVLDAFEIQPAEASVDVGDPSSDPTLLSVSSSMELGIVLRHDGEQVVQRLLNGESVWSVTANCSRGPLPNDATFVRSTTGGLLYCVSDDGYTVCIAQQLLGDMTSVSVRSNWLVPERCALIYGDIMSLTLSSDGSRIALLVKRSEELGQLIADNDVSTYHAAIAAMPLLGRDLTFRPDARTKPADVEISNQSINFWLDDFLSRVPAVGERTEAREILVVDLVSGGVLFRSDNKQKVWLAGGLRFSGERLSWGHGGVNLATGATWFDVPDRSLPIEPPVPEHKGIRLSPYLQWMARGRAAAFESLNTTPVDLEREFSIRDHYVSPVSGTSYAFGTMRYYIGVLVAYEGDTRCVAEYWIVPDGACFALSPDESLLVVGSEKGVVAWDLNASEVVGLWPATDPPISMTFSSVRTIVVRFASGGLSELELLGWTSSHDEREGWK